MDAVMNGTGVIVMHGMNVNGNGEYDAEAGQSSLEPVAAAGGDGAAGPELRLMTCGGDFDSAARSYQDNVRRLCLTGRHQDGLTPAGEPTRLERPASADLL